MTIPLGILDLFGWRKGDFPNIADKDSRPSVDLASRLFHSLGITRQSAEKAQTLGSRFEIAVSAYLRTELQARAPERGFEVGTHRITEFAQYRHLAVVARLVEEIDTDGTLRAEIGTDYVIKPDVCVGLPAPDGETLLHAAVSCKWTIRSDRVQNIRHEGVILMRHRRGRLPHVVTITCEPLPSRLASIARGTGEVDCVYHAALGELRTAVSAAGAGAEGNILDELTHQGRLRPLGSLPDALAFS